MRLIFSYILLFPVALTVCAQEKSLRLWYNNPATTWEQTFPLGNGRLGMTPDGGIERETIGLNEITLWSGSKQDANNYSASRYLPEIRSLLLEGKNHEAEQLINKNFVCLGKGSGRGNGANVPFGCYQTLGELQLTYTYDRETIDVKKYSRVLVLKDAEATCRYSVNDVQYSRSYFTSFDDDVGIILIQANKRGAINMRISLSRPERFKTIVQNNGLVMSGQLNNGIDGNGMQYITKVRPKVKDGSVSADGNDLVIRNASEVMIVVSAATNYKSENFERKADSLLSNALLKPIALQRKNHQNNYRKFFDRVQLSLGSETPEMTTDQRLKNFYFKPESDPALPALFFQFGRYLAISSTRVNLLPPNLQGLWAHQIQTPWNGDYHLDVNVQMNHWPLEVTNLSELNLPLADLVSGLIENGARTAKAYYNAEGWVAHVITNVWGFTEPGEDASWGATNAGSGWLCNNLWEHYAFTEDTIYLKNIYPILKGSAQFYCSVLLEDPKSKWLVTAPSVSPENSFVLPDGKSASICMGPTIDHQITRELFTNVIAASQKLGIDTAFRRELQSKLNQLPPAGRIGSDGRLMEWLEEYKEADPKHRHISHLYGLYPATLITPEHTPELAEACRKTLEVRGDDSPGWSKAYKILFWARLQDGDRAFKLLKELLKPTEETHINYGDGGGSYLNLLSAGPPFQIDGNFGGTAGIAEMLIQSHAGYIHFLPAIPKEWKKFGDVKGLRARGNFSVDMKWRNGLVTEYRIYSKTPTTVKVKVNGEFKEVRSKAL